MDFFFSSMADGTVSHPENSLIGLLVASLSLSVWGGGHKTSQIGQEVKDEISHIFSREGRKNQRVFKPNKNDTKFRVGRVRVEHGPILQISYH